MCWLVKHRWTCSPLLLVAMGTCLIIIDSLCMCLSAFIRALWNLVIVSFECKDINTQVWGEFCDLSYWIVNDEDAYKVMHRSISCAQWTQPRYRSCALWFTDKHCPRNGDRTACEERKCCPIGLHMRSKWASWGTAKVSLRPRTRLDVAKGVPSRFASVPIKHFGVLLDQILEDFGH